MRTDAGFKIRVIEHGAALGADVEIGTKPQLWASTWSNADGFVERTLGWLMHHRRLVRDYEADPTTPPA